MFFNCDFVSPQDAMTANITRPPSPLPCRPEQQTCTSAWKIFRICFWMRTEKMVASASSWVISCWILGKKIFIAASKGFLSSAFLYLRGRAQGNDQSKQTNKQCTCWYRCISIWVYIIFHCSSGQHLLTRMFWPAGRGRAGCRTSCRCSGTAGTCRSCPRRQSSGRGSRVWWWLWDT